MPVDKAGGKIGIPQAQTKQALAIYAHLRQILQACLTEDYKPIRPT